MFSRIKRTPTEEWRKQTHEGRCVLLVLPSLLLVLRPKICNSDAIKLNCPGQINWWLNPLMKTMTSTALLLLRSPSMHLHYSPLLLHWPIYTRWWFVLLRFLWLLDGMGKRRSQQDNDQWPLTVALECRQLLAKRSFAPPSLIPPSFFYQSPCTACWPDDWRTTDQWRIAVVVAVVFPTECKTICRDYSLYSIAFYRHQKHRCQSWSMDHTILSPMTGNPVSREVNK